MITKIIAAFPGTGKTTFHKNNPDISLDSDSSQFSWLVVDGAKIRNPDFPNNYISHIKENIGRYQYILVSSHKIVRDALLENCLFFYLVYPYGTLKEQYLKRYKDRGSDEAFIRLLDGNWEKWMDEVNFLPKGIEFIRVDADMYLENAIINIIDK